MNLNQNKDSSVSKGLINRTSTNLADLGNESLSGGIASLKNEDDTPKALVALLQPTDSSDSSSTEVGDLYASFVRQATRIPRLSEEEEELLGVRVRDHGDKKAARKLVTHNLRLAIKIAYQSRRSWTSLMDLVQEASTGMAIAAQRWDPGKGTRFGAYAAYWIRAQINKFLMTNARLIHTANTRAGRKIYFNLPAARSKLLAMGHEPTAHAIARELDEDPQEVALVLARLQGNDTSLSSPLNTTEDLTMQDTLPSPDASPENRLDSDQVQDAIKILIAEFEQKLTDERDMVLWREHLVASEPVSLVELGKRYGISKQRIGQITTGLRRAFRCHVVDRMGPKTQLSWLFGKN